MPATTRPTTRRRAVLAAGATALALGAAGTVLDPGVGAEPVDSEIPGTCAVATGSIDVTIPITVDDRVDPVPEGGAETVVIHTGMPELPVEATIQEMVVTMPVPDGIASVDDVTFTGGNMAATYVVDGRDVVLTFDGPVSSSEADVPVITAETTVATDIAPTTIRWRTFSSIDAQTNFGAATCTPNDPDQVVNETTVEPGADGPTPTTPPTTEPGGDGEDPAPTVPPAPTPTTPPTTTPDEPGDGSPAPVPPTAPAMPEAPSLPTLPTPPAPSPVPAPPGTHPSLPSLPPTGSEPGSPSLPPTGCPAIPLPGAPDLCTVPTLPPPPAPPATDGPAVDAEIDVELEVRAGASIGL